jgi:hypothetical protein
MSAVHFLIGRAQRANIEMTAVELGYSHVGFYSPLSPNESNEPVPVEGVRSRHLNSFPCRPAT